MKKQKVWTIKSKIMGRDEAEAYLNLALLIEEQPDLTQLLKLEEIK